MMPRLSLRLTPKFTVVYVLFAAILLISIGLFAYYSGRSSLENATVSDLLSRATEKEAALNFWISERESNLKLIAISPHVLNALDNLVHPLNSTTMQSAHEQLITELRFYALEDLGFPDLFIMNTDTGEIIVSTEAKQEGGFNEDQSYFINGKNGLYVQNPYYSLSLQAPTMTMAIPLRAADGTPLGVLAGQLDLSEMNTIIARRSSQQQTDDAFLVNSANLFITQPRFLSDPVVLQQGIHTEAVTRCLAGGNGVVYGDDYRGVPAIVVYRWLAARQLCLIVKIDQTEALEPVESFGLALAGVGGIALLAASLIGIALARTLTRPILALQAGVMRFGQGEMALRLPERSYDELGLLAHEFNAMATSIAEKDAELRTYTTQLEQKVADRTAELQASEAELRAIFTAIDDVILVLDSEGHLLKIAPTNPSVRFKPTSARLGQTLYEILRNTSQADQLMDAVRQALRTNDTVHAEIVLSIATDEIWLAISMSPMQGDTVLWIARDITAGKKAEDALRNSEKRFRALIENSADGILLLDPDRTILYESPASHRILGYADQRMGQKALNTLHPDDLVLGARQIEQVTQQPGMSVVAELRVQHTDGSWRWIERVLTNLSNELSVGAIVVNFRDVTERKRAEDERTALLVSEQAARAEAVMARDRLVFLLEASTLLSESLDYAARFNQFAQLLVPRLADRCTIHIKSDDGSVRLVGAADVNPQQVRLLYEIERLMQNKPVAARRVDRVLESGQPELYPDFTVPMMEAIVTDPDQRRVSRELGTTSVMLVPLTVGTQILGVISLVNTESGRRFGTNDLELVTDLARRAALLIENARLYEEAKRFNLELEARVEERTAQLQAANKELEAFSYSVSHDLRAPLRAMRGFSGILIRDHHSQLTPEAARHLSRIAENAERMGQLIDDLLAFSRLGRQPLNKQPVAPTSIVRQVLEELAAERENRTVTLSVAELPVCRADPALLKQVYVNLLSNALKFTRQRESAQIEANFEIKDGETIYFVKDNGAGFDMRYASKLFGVFQRLHRADEFEGTGVGLAIVQRIVTRHGGRIWAEAEVDRGAAFFFTLGVSDD